MRIIVNVLCLCFVMACSCMHNESNVRVGVCFTGQGVKIVGVANNFIERVPNVREKLKEIQNVVNVDVMKGEDKDLFAQGKAQEGLVIVQALIFEGIKALYPNLNIHCVIGQSLGNYTALYASGAITLEELLKFIKLRDELTAEFSSNSKQPYGMLVVQKIDLNGIQKYMDDERLFIAGMNTMSCFTVSGVRSEIEALGKKLQNDMPSIKLLTLNIAAPFHTKFMTPIIDELWNKFPKTQDSVMLIISDATGKIYNSGRSFDKNWMMQQLTGPMRWSGPDGVCQRIIEQKLTHLIVIGDGEGLKKMIKENIPGINVYVVRNVEQLDEVVRDIRKTK